MPNIKINEYLCKIFYNQYIEISNKKYNKMIVYNESTYKNADNKEINYVIKVDTGIKRRGKNSLIRYNIEFNQIETIIKEFNDLGYGKLIIEPFYNIKVEEYISISKTLNNIEILYCKNGGIYLNNENIIRYNLNYNLSNLNELPFNNNFLDYIRFLLDFSNKYQMTYVEINPLVIDNDNNFIPLDFAVYIDDTSFYLLEDKDITKILDSKSELNNL